MLFYRLNSRELYYRYTQIVVASCLFIAVDTDNNSCYIGICELRQSVDFICLFVRALRVPVQVCFYGRDIHLRILPHAERNLLATVHRRIRRTPVWGLIVCLVYPHLMIGSKSTQCRFSFRLGAVVSVSAKLDHPASPRLQAHSSPTLLFSS